MPLYEFKCAKGHVTEKLVPVGTKVCLCLTCHSPRGKTLIEHEDITAYRILSPTPTTFVHAGGRKP